LAGNQSANRSTIDLSSVIYGAPPSFSTYGQIFRPSQERKSSILLAFFGIRIAGWAEMVQFNLWVDTLSA
jgi:hypothetical protein